MRPKVYRVMIYMISGQVHVLDKRLLWEDVPRLSDLRTRTITVWARGGPLELLVAHIEAVSWTEVAP